MCFWWKNEYGKANYKYTYIYVGVYLFIYLFILIYVFSNFFLTYINMNSHWLRRTTYTHQNKPALSLHYPLTTNTHMKGPITVIHHRKATSHAHSRHQTISPYGNQPRPERLSHSGVSLPYLSFVCFTPPCITSSIPLRQAVISLVRFHLSYLANLSPDRQISANLWSLSGSLPSCLSRLQHLSWRAIFFFLFFFFLRKLHFRYFVFALFLILITSVVFVIFSSFSCPHVMLFLYL